MAGRHFLPCGRVVHVFNSVAAKQQAPVALCLLREIGHDVLINSGSLIELAVEAQLVDKVYLRMEGAFRVRRQAVYLFKKWQLLSLQGITPRTEQI